jgi:1D-myo-inositol 3-kinase
VPRLLAIGHVTRDTLYPPARGAAWSGRGAPQEVLGGAASYAALAARRLGWEAAVLTSAGPDFDPARELPGLPVFVQPASQTTRFENAYEEDGSRRQVVAARADDLGTDALPDLWRDPEVLLLGPVAGELFGIGALTFAAECVGAVAQGYLRTIRSDGLVAAREWERPDRDLLGVHVLFLSEHDLPDADARAHALLSCVPIVALTRGWRGLTLLTRERRQEVPSFPRPERDPTGAGDVFAAAFLIRYQETGDASEAAAFAACAASCVVEGVGTSTLGDRAEIGRRLALRERLIEDGEWEE